MKAVDFTIYIRFVGTHEQDDEIDAPTIWRRRRSMKPKVIKTEAEHKAALARIDRIFDARPDTPKGDELELLLLVETFEESAYPVADRC